MYRYLVPLSLVAFSLSAHAQTPPSIGGGDAVADSPAATVEAADALTLQAALALAMRANHELSAARYELQAVEAGILQARVLPNPSLDLAVEDTRRETRESTLQLSQPIELGGKRSARTAAAERARDAAAAELDARRAEIHAAVIVGFFDVLAAQERLRLAQEAVELARRGVAIAGKRVAAGKVSPVEETRARVAESSVRLELVEARSELASARRRLSATWGNAAPRFERADGRLETVPDLPDPASLAGRLRNAPVLARARHEVDRRRALAQLERSRRVPDMTVSVGIRRSEEIGRNVAVVGLSVPLPLFDGNRGNIEESLHRVDKARDELSSAEVRLGAELAQARERLGAAREDAESLRAEVLPAAQSAYDAAARGFEFGKFGFLEVLDAQRTLLQARSQYLRALSDAHRAAADIDRILGAPAPVTRQ